MNSYSFLVFLDAGASSESLVSPDEDLERVVPASGNSSVDGEVSLGARAVDVIRRLEPGTVAPFVTLVVEVVEPEVSPEDVVVEAFARGLG